MDLTIKIDTSKLDAVLKKKLQRVDKVQPLMDKIAADMLKETQLNFRREENPEGQHWQQLSKTTLANRRKEGKGAKILQDTGQLLQSIHSKAKSTKNTSYAVVGTNLDYAKTHQYGEIRKDVTITNYYKLYKSGRLKTVKKSKSNYSETRTIKEIKIPARAFIGINAKMKERYMKWIIEYLKS